MTRNSKTVQNLLSQADEARGENRLWDAKQKINTAVEISKELNDHKLILQSLNHLARIERDLGNIESSIGYYEDLVQISESNSKDFAAAHAIRHLGDIYREEKQLDKSEDYYRKALTILRNNSENFRTNFANALRGYALLLSELERNDESLLHWKEARSVYKKNHIAEGVEECDRWIELLS